MNFKVGQDVVCVNKNSMHNTIVGKTYLINRVKYCKCGKQAVDVGLPMLYSATECSCGKVSYDGIAWFGSFRFRPLEFISAHNELIEKFPIPEEVPDIEIKEPVL